MIRLNSFYLVGYLWQTMSMPLPMTNDVFNLLALATAFFYLLSAGFVAIHLIRTQPLKNTRTLMLITACISVALHAGLVTNNYWLTRVITDDFFNMLSLVFLVISLLFFISALSKPIETLAIIVFPFSAAAVLLNIDPTLNQQNNPTLDWQIQAHIVFSLLSYSLLSMAAFQAVLLSIQEKQLHNRHLGRFINSLPPMQMMEKLLFQVISLGLVLLTLALATGFVFIDDIFAQHLVHKTILSISAWLVFSMLLIGRHYYGWRGQKAIRWTYAGYLFLMLAYFGSKFVLQLILD